MAPAQAASANATALVGSAEQLVTAQQAALDAAQTKQTQDQGAASQHTQKQSKKPGDALPSQIDAAERRNDPPAGANKTHSRPGRM